VLIIPLRACASEVAGAWTNATRRNCHRPVSGSECRCAASSVS